MNRFIHKTILLFVREDRQLNQSMWPNSKMFLLEECYAKNLNNCKGDFSQPGKMLYGARVTQEMFPLLRGQPNTIFKF